MSTPRKAPDDGIKLADRVDRITQGDRRFFERFPDRRHRVRLASAAELQQYELLEGAPLAIPPGFKAFVVIRNVFPGARMRLFMVAPEGRETDVCEATAQSIFEAAATPYAREIEAQLRAAMWASYEPAPRERPIGGTA